MLERLHFILGEGTVRSQDYLIIIIIIIIIIF